MSACDILLDPISILQMSAYFEKKLSDGKNANATFGLLYAVQDELKYRICWSAPLGTVETSAEELKERSVHYEMLRLKRSKTTQNFYEEFALVGCYIMREKGFEKEEKKVIELAASLFHKGAPYYIIANPDESLPSIFKISETKESTPVRFAPEMERNDKLCIDSMYQQNSRESSIIKKCVEKQSNMIAVHLEKIVGLQKKLKDEETCERKKKQILQILEDYDRLVIWNDERKKQTIEAMNYSVMVGIGLNQYLSK